MQLFGGRFDSVPSEIIYLSLESEINLKRRHKQLAFSRFGSPRGKEDVDRSQPLFYFTPQEKNITVKLARLCSNGQLGTSLVPLLLVVLVK